MNINKYIKYIKNIIKWNLGFIIILSTMLTITNSMYFVSWNSMYPTYKDKTIFKDIVLTDKLIKIWWDINRWDIVVFIPPNRENISYIKRVIWLPWETIKIKNWYVYICKDKNNVCDKLYEPYLASGTKTLAKCWISEFRLWTWEYFVLWDNREHSTDSRCCFYYWCASDNKYYITKKDITWKVIFSLKY